VFWLMWYYSSWISSWKATVSGVREAWTAENPHSGGPPPKRMFLEKP
jgi:hypothetical protein